MARNSKTPIPTNYGGRLIVTRRVDYCRWDRTLKLFRFDRRVCEHHKPIDQNRNRYIMDKEES